MPPTFRDNQPPSFDPDRSELLATTLFSLLGLVNDWLKFAETKNAGIVGINSAALGILVSKVADAQAISPAGWMLVGPGGTCLLLSLFAGLVSFFPFSRSPRVPPRKTGAVSDVDNLYYFGHLAGYTPAKLAETMNDRYLNSMAPSIEEVHLALASQVITNARITLWKLNLFSFALVLFGAGFTLSIIGVVIIFSP